MPFSNDLVHTRTFDAARGLELTRLPVPRDHPDLYRLSNTDGGYFDFLATFENDASVKDNRGVIWTIVRIRPINEPFPHASNISDVKSLISEAMTAYGFGNNGTDRYSASVKFSSSIGEKIQ